MKSLVIVESPAKAKTINKYLGKNFVVKSSVGHIRDLDKFPKRKESKDKKLQQYYKLIQQMGVDPEEGWKAHYSLIKGKKKVLDELKKSAQDCEFVYLASDLDREGEAIAWHVKELLGGDEGKYRRVIFNEITAGAIKKAFENPIALDMNKVHSQQARRYLDRVVGYMLSPLLWQKVARGLSAGRVQSVALRLIAEREREISAFNPEEFWDLDAQLEREGKIFLFSLKKIGGKDAHIPNKESLEKIQESLKGKPFLITKREEKATKQQPSPPFITSTLQQSASTRLGFGVKKTMSVAQKLYEAGFITYMRTDSTNISPVAIGACRDYIESKIGKAYLPEAPRYYRSKAGAQEAHEAIRPSDAAVSAASLADLGRDAQNLYGLIWSRFVASQMKDANYLSTTISVDVEGSLFACSGRITLFDGFTKIYRSFEKNEDVELDEKMKEGVVLNFKSWRSLQKFTKPPARFNEASLVKELEKRGIGRPSTYATIISTIEERGYVKIESKRFFLQKIGAIVTDRLKENFSDLMSYDFTATMEEKLDNISEGKSQWREILDGFFLPFKEDVEKASEESGMKVNTPIPTDISCKVCGQGKMKIRNASTGVFLSCSNYELPPKQRCKATVNLIPNNEIKSSDEKEIEALLQARLCQICASKMDAYVIDKQNKIHICSHNPDCSGYEIEKGQFEIKGYEGPTLECDKCGNPMELKLGRFGKYFACAVCKNTRKLLKNGQAAQVKMEPIEMKELRCSKVDDHYLLRDGERGLFLAASEFPKKREIRSVYVDELLPHQNELPEKYRYLLSAPLKDKAGNRTFVKYDKKLNAQYVASEKNGKAIWKSYYSDGDWKD